MSAVTAIAHVQARILSLEQRLGVRTAAASTTVAVATRSGAPSNAFGALVAEIDGQLGSIDIAAIPITSPPGAAGAGVLNASTPFAELFEQAGQRWDIDPNVLAGIAFVESRFQTDVVSSAGAVGMMQLMPTTAASLGVDPRDPAAAIDAAARYLRGQIDRFGSVDLALAAYNVGPGSVADAGGIRPGSQAERYVNAVRSAAERM